MAERRPARQVGRGHAGRGHAGLGPLGRRLVLAFSLVSLVAVVLLVVAAQRAVERGLSIAAAGGRWGVAQDLAEEAATAYADAGAWDDADLAGVLETAADYGVGVVIRDAVGAVVLDTGGQEDADAGAGQGAGYGRGSGAGAGFDAGGITVSVSVDGEEVGSVALVGSQDAQARAEAQGRDVAWSWILGAAAAALGFAVLAGWFVTRRLTGPLEELTATARAFASGDRDARAEVTGTGEIADVARGFNDAVESAERSAAQRRQMAADVAHELRTPLAALQAGLEEVRDGLVPADAETLTRLHDQAIRLGRVVGDLSLLASPQDAAPGLATGRADLARIVADELAAREPELSAAGITLREVSLEPVEVLADADRLHQVTGNLLANVARHGRPGDTVDVAVRRAAGSAVLRVADTGPGIPAESLPRVFDRYWRGKHNGVTGSGLGLAVVREIVMAHGGTVEVTSPDGAGTTVLVRLPALAPAPVPEEGTSWTR